MNGSDNGPLSYPGRGGCLPAEREVRPRADLLPAEKRARADNETSPRYDAQRLRSYYSGIIHLLLQKAPSAHLGCFINLGIVSDMELLLRVLNE